MVIATTNRLEGVDPALRRPGRFDYVVRMGLPDAEGRAAIFRRHLARMATADGVDTDSLAGLTSGLSGAEIAGICRRSGLACIKEAVAGGSDGTDDVRIEARHLVESIEAMGVSRLVPLTSASSQS